MAWCSEATLVRHLAEREDKWSTGSYGLGCSNVVGREEDRCLVQQFLGSLDGPLQLGWQEGILAFLGLLQELCLALDGVEVEPELRHPRLVLFSSPSLLLRLPPPEVLVQLTLAGQIDLHQEMSQNVQMGTTE